MPDIHRFRGRKRPVAGGPSTPYAEVEVEAVAGTAPPPAAPGSWAFRYDLGSLTPVTHEGNVFASEASVVTGGTRNSTNMGQPEIYRSELWGDTRRFPEFGGTPVITQPLDKPRRVLIRAHYCELAFSSPGARVFSVLVNGKVLDRDLDLYAVTGGRGRPLVREYVVDAADKVVVTGTASVDAFSICGIEFLDGTGRPLSAEYVPPPPPPAPVGAVSPFEKPFRPDTWSKMPFGANVTFADDRPTRSLISGGANLNAPPDTAWTYSFRKGTTNDPWCWIENFDGGDHEGFVPDGMFVPEGTGPGGYDRPCCVIQPDGKWIIMYGTTQISRTHWQCRRVEDCDGYGDGISPPNSIGARADGLCDAWGIIRVADFTSGIIDHRLSMAPDPALLTHGFLFPAANDDVGHWYGDGGIIKGMVFGIPLGVARPTGMTAGGNALFDCLRDYGAQDRDEGGSGLLLYGEPDFNPGYMDWLNGMRQDMWRILPLIRHALIQSGDWNADQAAYNGWRTRGEGIGGGAPRRPYSNPLAPVGSW